MGSLRLRLSVAGFTNSLARTARDVYHRLPVTEYRKRKLKSVAYRLLRPLIAGTASYRHWSESQATRHFDADGATSPPIVAARLIPLAATDLAESAAGLVLPHSDDPLISILLPVYNQAPYSLCCLQSIAMHPPLADVEIIVIDDGSTDQTADMLAVVQGVRVVRNDANLGFLRSANRGARIARGLYLHLLNNDTQVQAGWLDALLAVFQSEPDTGIAGSKLIYPSGHLQEAGAALKRDGRVELVGLNENPALADYNCRRRVDHCSGASILIDKALFERLGGFDEVYAPAYYEDCDLSLRVQASGRHVIYEPSSVVVHHLSISTNAMPAEKMTRIETNRAIFLDRWQDTLDDLDSVRLIAFYLPQFHPIPENDRWWGKGFTEWTNVTQAKPNFRGHEQPRLPADLGFYDLRLAEVREAQADMARHYGVYGFCYYYYWFAGKRLLHRPLDEVLASGEPNFPFCICWANENWSRRWDGRESDVLIAQEHSDTDDLAFVKQLERLLLDRRYIRIRGRPLLLVYRIELLPDPARTAEIWREYCRNSGIGELFLASVQSFGSVNDPTRFGFDAAVEFPPHERAVLLEPQPRMSNSNFTGVVYDYRATAEKFMRRPLPPYPFFRTVMPSWDNTARRQNKSDIFVNSTPEAYGRWLAHLVEQTRWLRAPGERVVFVNAWNEWAEGNHLEPDQRHGHDYLEATRHALGAMRPVSLGHESERSASSGGIAILSDS